MSGWSQGPRCTAMVSSFEEMRLVGSSGEVPVGRHLNTHPRNNGAVGKHQYPQADAKRLFLVRLTHELFGNLHMTHIHKLVFSLHEPCFQFLHAPRVVSGVRDEAA